MYILDISVEELVDVFWYKIKNNLHLFEDILDSFEEEGENDY
jgi:hypothetical protein